MDYHRPNSGLQYKYNAKGYLESLRESRGGSNEGPYKGTVFQQVTVMDAWGNVVESVLGNGIYVSAVFDPLTGRLIDSVAATDPEYMYEVQDLHYEWDLIGNLKEKEDVTRDISDIISHEQTETYTYDRLNRLKTVNLSSPQLDLSNHNTMSLFYDEAGNITSKAGLSYYYGQDLAECTYKAGPHAVSSYDGITYCYDINGNNISSSNASGSSGRLITYTPYKTPSSIDKFYVGDTQASVLF
jgi:hypothetical protein